MSELTPVDLIVVSSECGDWHGLYVDGGLEIEGHAIYEDDWMRLIKKFMLFSGKVEKYWIFDEFLEEIGNFPAKFEEIDKKSFIK